MLDKEEIIKNFKARCGKSKFVELCGIKLEELECGSVVLSMKITEELTNPYGLSHGGALMTLLDTCIGISCLSVGKNVVTLNMTTNFIKGAPLGETVTATCQLIHKGKTTMVGESQLVDTQGRLLAKASATFFVIGRNEVVPEVW